MSQWEYCSLTLIGNEFTKSNFQTNQLIQETIDPDTLVDQGNSAITLRRHVADLGQNGWELITILTYETGQEWIFKRQIITTYETTYEATYDETTYETYE
jgi:hypothetical protein